MGSGRRAANDDEPAQLSDQDAHVKKISGRDDSGNGNGASGTRRIIVCADDFGMNEAINEGVLVLARKRRLSAVGCMTHAPAFQQHARGLAELDVDAGLHLNFTEALGQPGLYLPLSQLIARSYARTLDVPRVTRQIERQLDAFEAAMGRRPDFVDGHQHVHQLPQIRDALLATIARRYGAAAPWVRCSAPGRQTGLPAALRWKAHVIGVLGAYRFSRAAAAAGLRSNHRLLGVYDFQGGSDAYAALLPLWLQNMRDGDLLMCHPAMPHPGDTAMAAQRGAEFQVLNDAGFAETLLREGLRITRQPPGGDQASMTLRVNASR
ncbi:hypothetical protein CEY04_17490 [Achromobacter sp. HZ28]|nr:hypothetical protein CEY04_17490 [Achromobacter sp. HZ28]OWT76693.1 hypothetical protein CEY05_12940 [Achromobacter sp. HZ34]